MGSEMCIRDRPQILHQGDSRFARLFKDRAYVCDGCGSVKQYFDGQYVDYLGTKDYTPSELGYLYMQGLVDATWWCTTCHRRSGEDEDDTRVCIQVFEVDRGKRIRSLLQSGRKARWPDVRD